MSNCEIKGTPTKGLLGATLGFFIGFSAVVALGATARFFKEGLLLSGGTESLMGLLIAMPNLSGSLLRIPFAAWSDSVGARKPMMILLFLSILGLLGLVFIGFLVYPIGITMIHYPLLLLLAFLAGCGIATFSVGISQTSYWFPKKEQGKALGSYAGIGNLAPGLFSLIMTITLPLWGLGGSYLLWLILLTSGLITYYFIGFDACPFQLKKIGLNQEEIIKICKLKCNQEIFPSYQLKKSLFQSARNWKTWALVGLYFTSFGGFIALSAWLNIYWFSFHGIGILSLGGLNISGALVLTAIFIIVGSLMRVISGSLADKFTGLVISIIGIIILLIGAIVMMIAIIPFFILAFAGTLIIATGMGCLNAGVFKMMPDTVPEAVGGAAGWIGGIGAFGGFVIPPILGYFVDIMGNSGYNFGYIIFIIFALISLGIIAILYKKKVK